MEKYIVASSNPRLLSNGYKIAFLSLDLETYTNFVELAKVFESYEEAHEEAEQDKSNHDFVLHLEVAKKVSR